MNIFMIIIGVLYLGAAGWEYRSGSKMLTVVYFAWCVSNIALALKK
jgi:hypothetical membrane protein